MGRHPYHQGRRWIPNLIAHTTIQWKSGCPKPPRKQSGDSFRYQGSRPRASHEQDGPAQPRPTFQSRKRRFEVASGIVATWVKGARPPSYNGVETNKRDAEPISQVRLVLSYKSNDGEAHTDYSMTANTFHSQATTRFIPRRKTKWEPHMEHMRDAHGLVCR
jgi:hypothetical protein